MSQSNSTDEIINQLNQSTIIHPPDNMYNRSPSQPSPRKLVEYDASPIEWTPPAGYEQHVYLPHASDGSQYLRDVILGINDGLVSNLLLVLGMVGGGVSHTRILLTGIIGGIAGMISMGVGEYIATKSQIQVSNNDIKLESEHLLYHRDVEIQQCRQYLSQLGLDDILCEAIIKSIGNNDTALLHIMEKFEFGISDDELQRKPIKAMITSGRLYLIGALPSILPFISSDLTLALILSLVLCGLAAFTIGAYKTRTTRGNWLYGGMENLLLISIGAGIAYGIGVAFQTIAQDAFHTSIKTG